MTGMDDRLLRDDLAALYPQFGMRVAHAGLVLTPPTDVELFELAAIVAEPGGIVSAGQEHYLTWPTGDDDAARRFLSRGWALRVRPEPAHWQVAFAVIENGRAVGQAMLVRGGRADTVGTASWIARGDQGRGLGRRARLMLLELAFEHLGAARAITAVAVDNAASQRVSARCGYREFQRRTADDGTPEIHLAVTPGAWRRRRLGRAGGGTSGAEVVVEGAAAFRAAITPGGSSP